MTSRRIKGDITYICDWPDCFAMHTVPTGNYETAWRIARAAGWLTVRHGSKWYHFCSWLHRPNTDEQLKRLIERPDLNPREVKHRDS